MKVDTLPTGRTYHTPAGSFPSLTTILGKTSKDLVWLQKWKDTVGEEEAARVSKEATDRGTLVHKIAELFFNNEDYESLLKTTDKISAKMAINLINATKQHITTIFGQEQILWSSKLRYAGRTDMVGIWKGKPCIIDFKTSKKLKKETKIRDYFVQGCGYAVAHNELFGTAIKDMVIIITVEDDKPQIFEKSAVPFLYELKSRRIAYDSLVKQ